MGDEPRIESGRVMRSSGGIYEVYLGGEIVACSLRGRLKQEREVGKVAVGDEVELELLEDGSCVIGDVRPRHSLISRRAAQGRKEQIIAANVDQLAAVFSTQKPDPIFMLLDRLLVLAESSEIGALLVVNKLDLVGREQAQDTFGFYEEIGYELLYTSAKEGQGVDELEERLTGCTTLLAGPSGVGKSTLLNAIQPGLGLRVGDVSEALEKGRHTTVEASMHALDAGGFVVDSPGIRRLRLWEVGERDLGWCFPEFKPYLGECRFHDCKHIREPDCAIRQALAEGRISERRYESYRRILEEGEGEPEY